MVQIVGLMKMIEVENYAQPPASRGQAALVHRLDYWLIGTKFPDRQDPGSGVQYNPKHMVQYTVL